MLTIYLIITNEMNSSLRSVVVLLGAPLSGEAAKTREQTATLPSQSPRDFSAPARLYYLARLTKTAMLRRLDEF